MYRSTLPSDFSIVPDVPPLGISPDGRSFVRFGSYYDGDNRTAVAVADFVGNRSYRLRVDEARMRQGERMPVDSTAYHHPVRIDGQIIHVAYGGAGSYVSVSLPDDVTNKSLIESVARHIDQAVATGKYDAPFGK